MIGRKRLMRSNKFRISKWIMLTISILLNGFIIFYSCLDNVTTAKWNVAFTNFFTKLINSITTKKNQDIPLKEISIDLSDEVSYKYNYIPGYKVDEIPLGSAKQIECTFSPDDATNKSIVYSANPSENVVLNQSGATLSVVGMKTGDCTITATSNDGNFISSKKVKIVECVAPTDFSISLKDNEIALGTTKTIDVDVDGGNLGHNELVNFRYYDNRKLVYTSSNESVATIDNYGVIYPVSVGNATIQVSNGSISKTLNVEIADGVPPEPISNLTITGADSCYANDMIIDQSSKKNHYQMTPKDGEKELDPEDFIWYSSNELLAKVDKHGVLRGFRKSSVEDESVVITAKSKLTGSECSKTIIVKNQLPTAMYVYLNVADTLWNPTECTVIKGDNIGVNIIYSPSTQVKTVTIDNSDESIISVSNEGESITLHVLNEGECTIKITSIVNPDLSQTIKFTAVNSGAISNDNVGDFGKYIRKSLGHAAVFMVAQIFTFLALYMFLFDKKWWLYSSISLGEGLFISALSELIQYIVPTRSGVFLDVLIDFSGVVVGFALVFLGLLIVKKIIKKKAEKKNN